MERQTPCRGPGDRDLSDRGYFDEGRDGDCRSPTPTAARPGEMVCRYCRSSVGTSGYLIIFESLNIRPGGLLADDDPTPGSNLANRIEFRLGDVDQGFQEADVIVEHETFTCPIHQGYIEPHTGTAQWNNDGTLTIWSSSQGHFNVRDQTARLLNVPVSMVRAIPMEIGGGFGGKTIVYVEPVAAALARKAGRPVQVTMSRRDGFEATGPTSGTQVRVKIGATKDGRLVAGEAHLVYEAGAFPGSPMPSACQGMMGPYDIPNVWIEGFDVVVNKPKSAAYRAPGVPA